MRQAVISNFRKHYFFDGGSGGRLRIRTHISISFLTIYLNRSTFTANKRKCDQFVWSVGAR